MAPHRMLSLTQLVEGLERDGTRYQALDIFAWQVREVRDALEHRNLGELRVLGRDAEHTCFGFERNGSSYQINVHRSGVARLTRRAIKGLSSEQVALGAVGAAVGAIAAGTIMDSGKDLPAMVLGFLVGAALGTSPDSPRRALTIRYDEEQGRWRAYDGPLAKWIREQSRKADAALG